MWFFWFRGFVIHANRIIALFIHVKQGIKFCKTFQFLGKLRFLLKRLVYFCFRCFKLMFHIGKFHLCLFKLCRHCFQRIVDTGDIAKRISADLHRMAHGTFDIHHELIVERIKGYIQLKSKIFPYIRTGIDAFDFLTHGYDRSSCFLFICIRLSSHLHEKLFLILRLIFCIFFHISGKTFDTFLENSDLMRIMLCNIVLHAVLLTGMICLHQFQFRYLNIEIHLFFYVRITCGKCLDLRIGKCRFVHILTASYRRFAGHNLSDEFLLILYELPLVTVKRTFRNITKYLDLIILVALS